MMLRTAVVLAVSMAGGGAMAQESAVPRPAPSAERLELARAVAANGLLISLIPVQTRGEIDGMIAENPDLTAAEQARLREIGQEQATALEERVLAADAAALATHLSADDLRVIAAFERTEAAARRRAAMPAIMVETMQALGEVDYGNGVKAAFCAETARLCGG
ncbi:hypothetical protein V5740_02790 [Croceibacterium sp. TMG7-5b_MA50]|uniref:hypothetical protein n=1 Tax=Croceibacterium sp. TMG7-5b_MA50 TaxID=3121290 RepID=UPI0032220AD9